MNAVAAEPDPTLEIRHLIEQLQQNAREARTQLQSVSAERDDLRRQLEKAIHQTDELRSRERDARAGSAEVAAITRERDLATTEAKRSALLAVRAQEQVAVVIRERDALTRERDETLRRIEGLTRAYSASGLRVSELQKQLNTIRQARDSAHAQNSELTARIAAKDDENAELTYQRDQARRSLQKLEEESATYKKEIELLRVDRVTDAERIGELTAQLDAQRKKFLDLAEQKTAITQAGNEHAIALAEARSQVASLSQERDTARLLTQAQGIELEKLRSEFHSYRETGTRAASDELDTLRERLSALECQAREARLEAAEMRRENVVLSEKLASLEVVADDATAHQEESELQLLTLTHQHEATQLELQAARTRVEEVTAELLSTTARTPETSREDSADLPTSRQHGGTEEAALHHREMQQRADRQRLQTLELAAQLESAQRSIRELSASLAEARLQVKFALSPRTANPASPMVNAPETPIAPLSSATESLDELIPSLRETFDTFAGAPANSDALLRFHDRVVTYAERARVGDCIALYRLAHALASLLESIASAPGDVARSTLDSVRQAAEFFISLRGHVALEEFPDPARARVLVVDDDESSCQCVQLILQEQMMQTFVSFDPSSALLELASDPFDLIILDVNMPDMNGFELCRRLRELPHHGRTPVVFLTGLATDERREQSILAGGHDFLGKPFHLHELVVRALLLVLKNHLVAAATRGGR